MPRDLGFSFADRDRSCPLRTSGFRCRADLARTSAVVLLVSRSRLQPPSEEDAMERDPVEEMLEERLNHPLTVHLEDQLLAALADDSDQPSDD
jgi:hypothetical protein